MARLLQASSLLLLIVWVRGSRSQHMIDAMAKYNVRLTEELRLALGQLAFIIKAGYCGKQLAHLDAQMQVVETPEVYKLIVRPYIDSIPASRIQWVYNILEKKVSCHLVGQSMPCHHAFEYPS